MAYGSLLADRAVLALSGVETRGFLQGLLTNDMEACVEGAAIYAGLLTPQGKILFEFFVVVSGEEFFLDCAKPLESELIKRLSQYRLRAKIAIAARPELGIAAFWGKETATGTGLVAFADPRLPALGQRVIGSNDALRGAMVGRETGDYTAHRLGLGVPDSADMAPDQVFALDAGFEELNGVSFKKGCYVGQEVTSRMKHRASARRRFLIAEFAGALAPQGTSIAADGRELGVLASGQNNRALALIRLDRLAQAEEKHAAITAGGGTLHLRKPDWLTGLSD